MNTAVVYFSRTGNTRKIAEAMAKAIGCKATGIAEFDAQASYDLLFIGGAVYGAKLDPALTQFICSLDPAKIRRAAAFCTYFKGETAVGMMKTALEARGIAVDERSFRCRGKFLFMQKKYPGEADVAEAGKFALAML